MNNCIGASYRMSSQCYLCSGQNKITITVLALDNNEVRKKI